VTRIIPLKKHLRTLRRSTRLIARTLSRLGSELRRLERDGKRRAADPKRRLRITPKRRAQLKLQGAYMGYMGQLRPAQKARVKAVKERRGYEAAIAVARSLVNR